MGLFAGYDIAIALVGVMLAVFGIVLGLGIATNDRKLKELGRNEIYQAIINGAIIGSLFIAFSQNGIVSQILSGAVNSTSASVHCSEPMENNAALCFAYTYLTSPSQIQVGSGTAPTLFDSDISLLIPVTLLAVIVGLVSSLGFSFIIQVSLSSALAPIVHQLNYIVSALTFALIGIEVQGALMLFISIVAIPMLLPIGMVLRSFFATRKLGGAMMAIAIGLSTVFPLTYVLDFQMSQSYSSASVNSIVNSTITSAQNFQSSLLGETGSMTSNSANATNSTSGQSQVLSITSLAVDFVKGGSAFFQQVTDEISLLIVQVFFFPIFSIILTVISIRELATILGSEISLGKFDIF
ncbi:MAG: hypothetical protein LVQ95_02000 [Candidatus Micrarchaeales archaeon]|nr:hypothetical protein [Candidatus Micrarchaeales archaeon]